jgi:hypothetical protein
MAQDGHMCDSFAERIIDEWLAINNITHERSVRYPRSKMTADFYLPLTKTYIEFFGLLGAKRKYDKNHARKLLIVQRNALSLIALYTDDILKKTYIEKLKKFSPRTI